MSLPQSPGFQIVATVLAAISAEPTLSSLPLVRNPRRPSDLGVGDQVLIVTEHKDKQLEHAGAGDKRRRIFSVGALSRVDGADADADALYQLVSDTVQTALRAMQQAGMVTRLAETEMEFDVADMDVDGAIVLGSWEVDYARRRPR